VFIKYSAQESYSIGYLPALNFNAKLSKPGSLNLNIQQRTTLFNKQDNKLIHRHALADLTVMYGHKIGLYSKISIGGLLRCRNNELIERTIQQFVRVSQLNQLKLINRFRLDQTYFTTGVEYRLRYRLGVQVPLNGTEVDNREMYLKVNNEYLAFFATTSSDLEVRVVSSLGYVINKKNKIEVGIDNRFSKLLAKSQSNSFWVTFGLYLSLK
jgi:hypothetical protein